MGNFISKKGINVHAKKLAFGLFVAGFIASAVQGASAGDAQKQNGSQGSPGCDHGVCWGLLMVPFKAELAGNQDVYGSATVGPYVGFDFGPRLAHATPFAFAGYSQNIGAINPGGNQSFVSYGGGLMFPVSISKTNELEFGLVVGFDHTANSNNFAYNDKPWVSALIGFSFN
jgi:hypothetical protein